MEEKDTITVYWAPNPFFIKDQSFNMLFREPESVFAKLIKEDPKRVNSRGMRVCPATRDMFKNVYTFRSAIDDHFTFDIEWCKKQADLPDENMYIPTTGSKVEFTKTRASSFDGYIDVDYNLSWVFLADEPVVAKFTAPYFPPSAPAKGAIYATGKFDIGRWFRPILTNLHVPLTTDKFGYSKDQEIFYMELMTEKKVKFQRFNMNPALKQLREECGQSPSRLKRYMSLEDRYKHGEDTELLDRVMREIKKNLAT